MANGRDQTRHHFRIGAALVLVANAGACGARVVVPIDSSADRVEADATTITTGIYITSTDPRVAGRGALSPMSSVTAGFYPSPSARESTEQFDGPCQTITRNGLREIDAGALTLTWDAGSIPVPAHVIGSDGTHYSFSSDSLLWQTGTHLVLSATGGEFPAFSVNVDMPSPALVRDPPQPASATDALIIPAGSGLRIVWEGSPPFVWIQLGIGGGASAAAVRCWFPGSPGSAVVPSSLLAPFRGHTAAVMNIGSANLVITQVAWTRLYTSAVVAEWAGRVNL